MNKLLYIFLLSFGIAATINVPGDYDTIQDAIDAANDNDEIDMITSYLTKLLMF